MKPYGAALPLLLCVHLLLWWAMAGLAQAQPLAWQALPTAPAVASAAPQEQAPPQQHDVTPPRYALPQPATQPLTWDELMEAVRP
jgi:hypothetical protein